MLDLVRDVPVQLLEPSEGPDRVWDAVESARGLAAALELFAAAGDETSTLPTESLAALHRSGLPLAVFARASGGCDLLNLRHAEQLARVLRLVGAGDLSIGRLFEGHVNAVALVERFGTRKQVAMLAAAVRRGGLSAVWNAEGREPLTATAEPEGFALKGQKILASGAGIISHPIVTPRIAGQVMMVVLDGVATQRIDLSGWNPMGMRASATGTVDLTGAVTSYEMQIGSPGDYLRQPWFSAGAWRFCAVHLGAAERLLDLFRDRLRQRRRIDDAYQKQRIATATTACLTARLWIDRAAGMLAAEEETVGSIVAFANLTRMVTERACLDVLEAVQRGVGLGAFMRLDPIERISRDLATYLRQPVPDAAMADAAAHVLARETATSDLWTV